MSHCFLTLKPYGKQPSLIELSTSNKFELSAENIVEQVYSDVFVYSDLSYEMELKFDDDIQILNVLVYINEINEPCTYNDGVIRFSDNIYQKGKVFLDCFGFVSISLLIQFIDGIELNYESEYIPVLVKKGNLNESVRLMIHYVYENQEYLLLNGQPKAKDIAGFKEDGVRGLETQIILAEEIATIYESSYGYFRINSRFKLEKMPVIERIEKLQQVDSKTIHYIAQHPEQLRRTNVNSGISIANKYYYPQKTLIMQNVYSRNIYENRVIIGFLKNIMDSICDMLKQLEELERNVPKVVEFQDEYINSSKFIFTETKKIILQNYEKLNNLYRRFVRLFGMYNEIFQVTFENLESIPKSSAIFKAVPQYNRIYTKIIQWYKFGIYDLTKEKYMLSFIKISQIYESYLLSKFINYFKKHGFIMNPPRLCEYPIRKKWKYQNTKINNTFVFSDETQRITLYYQPVIYDKDCSSINGIELYRNNTISISNDDEKERNGHYYVPDYLIKCERDNCVKYIIFDAKFSSLSTVRYYYVPNLSYKYLFSISSTNDNANVSGLCIIYGQCTEENVVQSIYDRQIVGRNIKPFVEALPMIEGLNNDKHIEYIETVLKML